MAPLIDPNYMSRQEFLTPSMRLTIVSWMRELHYCIAGTSVRHVSKLTYFLAVTILDTFCTSVHNIKKSQYQLWGITAVRIATKYCDVRWTTETSATRLSYLCCNHCTQKEINAGEKTMLNALGWAMPKTSYEELQKLFQMFDGQLSREFEIIAHKACQASTLDIETLKYDLITTATACMLYANEATGQKLSPSEICDTTGCQKSDALACLEVIKRGMDPKTHTVHFERVSS